MFLYLNWGKFKSFVIFWKELELVVRVGVEFSGLFIFYNLV